MVWLAEEGTTGCVAKQLALAVKNITKDKIAVFMTFVFDYETKL
jgi:hypothetical protein